MTIGILIKQKRGKKFKLLIALTYCCVVLTELESRDVAGALINGQIKDKRQYSHNLICPLLAIALVPAVAKSILQPAMACFFETCSTLQKLQSKMDCESEGQYF